MNMIGGGNGIPGNRAVLVARIPSGSTVTATKGGIVLTPMMWVSETYPDQDIALFVFAPAQFDSVNPWTITATDGTDTASDTILVTTNKEYEIELSYDLMLYDSGTFTQLYTTTNLTRGGTITDESTYILCATTPNYIPYVYKRWNLVDVTDFNKLTAYMQAHQMQPNTGATVWAKAFLTQNASLTIASQAEYVQALDSTITTESQLADFNFEIDISMLTGNWYIGVGIDNDGTGGQVQRQGKIITVSLVR